MVSASAARHGTTSSCFDYLAIVYSCTGLPSLPRHFDTNSTSLLALSAPALCSFSSVVLPSTASKKHLMANSTPLDSWNSSWGVSLPAERSPLDERQR